MAITNLATTDDSSGMTHSPAGGRSHSSDEAHNWLRICTRVVLLQVLRSLLLRFTSNLTNHDDSLSLGIIDETLKAVDEIGAVEGIATNTDTEGLSKTHHGGLVDGFICESARPGDNPNAARLVDVAWHDANLTSPRCNNARAVGTNEPGLALSQEGVFDLDHVLLGNSLRDADNKRDFSFQGFHDCCCCSRWRHIDHSGIRLEEWLDLLNQLDYNFS